MCIYMRVYMSMVIRQLTTRWDSKRTNLFVTPIVCVAPFTKTVKCYSQRQYLDKYRINHTYLISPQSSPRLFPHLYLYRHVTHDAVRFEMPPGLSDTVVTKRTRRWSAARPRSITRPRTGTSMLPPHRGITTFLPGVDRNMSNMAREKKKIKKR